MRAGPFLVFAVALWAAALYMYPNPAIAYLSEGMAAARANASADLCGAWLELPGLGQGFTVRGTGLAPICSNAGCRPGYTVHYGLAVWGGDVAERRIGELVKLSVVFSAAAYYSVPRVTVAPALTINVTGVALANGTVLAGQELERWVATRDVPYVVMLGGNQTADGYVPPEEWDARYRAILGYVPADWDVEAVNLTLSDWPLRVCWTVWDVK